MSTAILPVCRANKLPDTAPEKRWLIDDLWSYSAVGIIGGEPKCGKSILALSMAVAVASGTPCLAKFNVATPARVLLFAAEDALPVVKNRLAAISLAHNVSLSNLDIFVITRPSLRLDIDSECEMLKNTVQKLSPRLLILDPFVRLHRIDENSSAEVAPVLSKLRHIQRSFHTSVILVHHARKDSKHSRQGQALRGSSEFHAWGDSNLYLRRNQNESISLSIEHRAEQAPAPVQLTLAANDLGPFHKIVSDNSSHSPKPSPEQKIIHVLDSDSSPFTASSIRAKTNLRTQVVSDTLNDLINRGIVIHSSHGYSLQS